MTSQFNSLSTYSLRSTFSKLNVGGLSDMEALLQAYKDRIFTQLQWEEAGSSPFPLLFDELRVKTPEKDDWVQENTKKFFKDTPNKELEKKYFLSALGYITSVAFSPDGEFVVVGHATGLIQARHGHTGDVLETLRSIQFPPKPVYAIEFSPKDDRVCFACCADGAIYKIDIPQFEKVSIEPGLCIKSDPDLEWLKTVYYGAPGECLFATPFISQRLPVLSMSITCDGELLIAGYSDNSVKILDIATQTVLRTYKVHKMRLKYIPRKLQRMHAGQVIAARCHPDDKYIFGTAGWDNTFRIWDTRCEDGSTCTFEDVNVVGDAIDLNGNHAITGSWSRTEGLSLWDLTAKKRISILRIQNRRPNVDGEYFYTCRYWRSSEYNREGTYGIVGGSGTECVEVINLNTGYIACSYPAVGSVLAVASHGNRICFGGTAPVFNIVSFHDPEQEEYLPDEDIYDYSKNEVTQLDVYFQSERTSQTSFTTEPTVEQESENLPESEHLLVPESEDLSEMEEESSEDQIEKPTKPIARPVPIDISNEPAEDSKWHELYH